MRVIGTEWERTKDPWQWEQRGTRPVASVLDRCEVSDRGAHPGTIRIERMFGPLTRKGSVFSPFGVLNAYFTRIVE